MSVRTTSARSSKRSSARASPSTKASSANLRMGSARTSNASMTKKLSNQDSVAKLSYSVGGPKLRRLTKLEMEDSEQCDPPEGIVPIFISNASQLIFEIEGDKDVSQEYPFKLLSKQSILEDLKNRAAVSDFSVVKELIKNYPGNELLIAYDFHFKYSQNFYLVSNEELKNKILNPTKQETSDDEASVMEEEDTTVYEYRPPESKIWQPLGSEVEIEEQTVKDNRPRIKMRVSRCRRDFGAPIKFQDRNCGAVKDGYVECPPLQEKGFDLKRVELGCGVQAVPVHEESFTQTNWQYPKNAVCQYEPREFDEETRQNLAQSEEVLQVIEKVTPRFELCLQHNEVLNAFDDDWCNLAQEDTNFGTKADSHLKEYQSFTDLQFSKNKTITSIDWHPSIKGVLAVSYGERCTFDERIDNLSKIQVTPSLVLIWSFSDPIRPQIILEAPDDISVIRFCPTDPNTIAGGCINGQLVLWDITQHSERLRVNKRNKSVKASTLSSLPGFIDENSVETPIVYYCAMSSIEHSHRNWITDLQWLPDHIENFYNPILRFSLTKKGGLFENSKRQCVQLVSCACDGYVLFWDIRPPKGNQSVRNEDNPLKVPNTYAHLDLTWKPLMKVPIAKEDDKGEHSPFVFSYPERQGDASSLPKPDPSTEEKTEERKFSTSFRPSSPKDRRSLMQFPTKYYIGTEDGELIFLDWSLEKDTDSGKLVHKKPEYCKPIHDGPVHTVVRSHFFKNVILSVGGWNFAIWREEIEDPLLLSMSHNIRLTAGQWSPSRPAVFFICRQDGTVDVWDLLDKTHDPVLSQSISPHSVTRIYPLRLSNKQQFLAVGDSHGTLHILEVPWIFRHASPNETTAVAAYFDREQKRLEYVEERVKNRAKEKRKEAENSRTRQGAGGPHLSEEEQRHLLQQEYNNYLELEHKLLVELGIAHEVNDPL